MVWVVLGCIVAVAAVVLVFCQFNDATDRFLGVLTTLIVALLIVCPIVCWLVRATGGLMPGYGEGVRYGYVTKMSYRGLYWKTYEGQMQIGTGEMAALQEPFSFCVPDKEVRDQVVPLIGTGQKVGLQYRQWLLIPFPLGSSHYEIVGVEHAKAP